MSTACLWFLARDRHNGRFRDRRGEVLFIDARKLGYMVDRTQRELAEEDIEALLREHVPGIEVWAYGSRVNGESHDASDLDLVLRGPDLKRIPSSRTLAAQRDTLLPKLVSGELRVGVE